MNNSTEKVKININCPHCGEGNVRDTNNYHDILHEEHFTVDEVIDFDEMKTKIDDGVYQYSLLADAYYYLIPFVCVSCGKGVKVVNDYSRSDDMYATHPYKIKKAGKFLPYSFVKRFFYGIVAKNRGIPPETVIEKDSDGFDIRVKCDKERYVDRVWKIIKKDIINKPFLVKLNGEREIVYISGVEYTLGWGEEVTVYAYTLLGNVRIFKLDHNGMKDFEWLEVDNDLAKKTLKLIEEF